MDAEANTGHTEVSKQLCLPRHPMGFAAWRIHNPSQIGDSFSTGDRIVADMSSLEKHIGLYIVVKIWSMSTDA